MTSKSSSLILTAGKIEKPLYKPVVRVTSLWITSSQNNYKLVTHSSLKAPSIQSMTMPGSKPGKKRTASVTSRYIATRMSIPYAGASKNGLPVTTGTSVTLKVKLVYRILKNTLSRALTRLVLAERLLRWIRLISQRWMRRQLCKRSRKYLANSGQYRWTSKVLIATYLTAGSFFSQQPNT